MWKKIVVTFFLLLIMQQVGVVFSGEDTSSLEETRQKQEAMLTEQLELMPTSDLQTYWHKLALDYGGYFPENQLPSFEEMLFGGETLSLGSVLQGLLRFMWHEVLYNSKLIVTIVILTIFCMVLETLQTAFERQTVSKAAHFVSYLVLIIIAINSFHVAMNYAKDSIGAMAHFMMAMIPLLLALLAAMGSLVTVSVLHPLIIFMINAVGTAIHLLVFPLLFFSAVLHIASTLTSRFKLTQLANMLRVVGIGVLGVLLTAFLGVVSVQGATGAITDGVALRTAKFVTSNFVPVVGKMFSDATDTVISASLLAKNAVGLAGVIVLLFISAFPAIKIAVLALIYSGAAAIMQPLGNTPVVTCLQTIGKTMIYVFAALAAVSLMFFLAITIILTAGNATLMVR